MKLKGKRALITGSSQGFGLAVAQAYVKEGASVMLCARDVRQLDKAQQSLIPLARGGAKVVKAKADVSIPADIDKLVATAVHELGGLDILVANAGVYGPQ